MAKNDDRLCVKNRMIRKRTKSKHASIYEYLLPIVKVGTLTMTVFHPIFPYNHSSTIG
jgi:hypothetical protein